MIPTCEVRAMDYLISSNFLGVRLTISCIKDKRGRPTECGGFILCSNNSNHWKSDNDGSFAFPRINRL